MLESWRHQAIHGLHQWRCGAPVVEQIVDAIDLSACALVGVEIATTKAIDRLFGVAHHQQEMVAGGKGLVKEFPLQRIGVLKFVDQCNLVAGPKGCDPRLRPGWIRGVQGIQQAGETNHSATLASLIDLVQTALEQIAPGLLPWTIPERSDGLHQLRSRQAWGGFAAFAGCFGEDAWVEKSAKNGLIAHVCVTNE